ncbi:MAG: hypothetical protein K2M42_11945 [Oscillospiraceae bacterium]|nr:hypothetical protein [Oscillospiraceae bacterium]
MADIRDAMRKITEGDFENGFMELAEAYGKDQQDINILDDLKVGFWSPNLEEMEENYRKNASFLAEYPFLFSKEFVQPRDNRYLLFPLSEELFYCFDQHEYRFTPMEVNSDRETRYFFEHLDQPIILENEYNVYNLRFLRDNVRRSEDFAGDNHIYLHYPNIDAFSLLLYYADLEELCGNEQFVFLVGTEREMYPLDFKARFGIDYAAMEPKRLRIEEMQRICFWYKRGYSGTLFGLNLLDHNRYIVMRYGADLFYYTYVNGHPLFETNLPEEVMNNTDRVYTLSELENLYHHLSIQWGVTDMSDFIHWLKDLPLSQFTLPTLFRAYFIYKYYQGNKCANPRIVPVILWEPHVNAVDIHNPLILDFPYITVLNSVRDPIKTVGRIYQREGSIFITQTLAIGYSMHPQLRKNYYGYRLEDAKLHPVETCQALCKVLNVPYDPNMLNDDEVREGINGEPAVVGFDTAPLHRNVDAVLSPFDQCRLQIFFDPLLRHFGYPAFNFDECPMDDHDVAFLFKFPFKFEKDYVENGKKWGEMSEEQLRQHLLQNMVMVWQVGKRGELVFPNVIKPELAPEESCQDL